MEQQKAVVPGKPAVDTICATSTLGELILREIAESKSSPFRQRWNFGWWNRGVCRGTVSTNGSHPAPLTLHLYTRTAEMGPRVLILQEVRGKRLSLKPTRGSEGALAINLWCERASKSRIRNLASQIVATFVLHGHGWKDRKGREYSEPYGATPQQPREHRPRKRNDPRHHRYLHPYSTGE